MPVFCEYCQQQILGRRSNAKYCSIRCQRRVAKALWKVNNPEAYKRSQDKNNQSGTRKMLSNIKAKAKRLNIPFDLELKDLVVPEVCPVLGIKIEFNYGKGSKVHDTSPTVDRIYPEKGYVKGNVRVISGRANLLKSNASVEEIRLVLKDLESRP